MTKHAKGARTVPRRARAIITKLAALMRSIRLALRRKWDQFRSNSPRNRFKYMAWVSIKYFFAPGSALFLFGEWIFSGFSRAWFTLLWLTLSMSLYWVV